MQANIRQTTVYMQMLANFCQHLPIYNQATWKPIHPSASSLPNMVVDLEEDTQETLNFQPLGLNLTQNLLYKKLMHRASLVVQWLRICLLMQGTWVRALVWEDPTCRGAARPVSHNY